MMVKIWNGCNLLLQVINISVVSVSPLADSFWTQQTRKKPAEWVQDSMRPKIDIIVFFNFFQASISVLQLKPSDVYQHALYVIKYAQYIFCYLYYLNILRRTAAACYVLCFGLLNIVNYMFNFFFLVLFGYLRNLLCAYLDILIYLKELGKG